MTEHYLQTWCWLLKLLVLLQTLISASSGPLGTGCIWRSSISPDMPDKQEITPRPECPEGHLYWYYPKGTLAVSFEHESRSSRFQLCVNIGNDIDLEDVFHVQGVKRFKQVRSENTCVSSKNGVVLLEFKRSTDTLNIPRLNVIKYIRVDDT